MTEQPHTSALARMIPMLSGVDRQRGYEAVMHALQDMGVVRFDSNTDRLIFRACEVSELAFNAEVEKRLRDS